MTVPGMTLFDTFGIEFYNPSESKVVCLTSPG